MSGEANFSFEDRYGIKPAPRWKAPAVVLAVVGALWILWAGLHHANPDIRATLISFQVVNEKSISITYEVQRRDASQEILCTLIARDFDKNTIGQIEDVIAAGESRITREITIPTRAKPVNAAVSNCRAK